MSALAGVRPAFAGPNGHDSPSGCNFLVIFLTTGTVTLSGTSDGRQWFGSVLAPWAEVVVDSSIGFVDGLIVARSYREVGNYGQLQLHGGCPTCVIHQCGAPVCSGKLPSSSSSAFSSPGACVDRKPVKKCRKKMAKGKCRKNGVMKKCSSTCGACSSASLVG